MIALINQIGAEIFAKMFAQRKPVITHSEQAVQNNQGVTVSKVFVV